MGNLRQSEKLKSESFLSIFNFQLKRYSLTGKINLSDNNRKKRYDICIFR